MLHYRSGKRLLNKLFSEKNEPLYYDSFKSNSRADKTIASVFLAVSAKCQSEISLATLPGKKSYIQQ